MIRETVGPNSCPYCERDICGYCGRPRGIDRKLTIVAMICQLTAVFVVLGIPWAFGIFWLGGLIWG